MGICYVILGTTRSGTSVTAGLLHRMGVVMGWELIPENGATERYDWPDPTEANPRGWYQDAPLENLQDAIFGDEYPPVGTVATGPLVEKWKDEIRLRCNRGHAKWGFKTSRIAWLFDEFLDACTDEVKFVQTRRTKELSARSLNVCWPSFDLSTCQKWVGWTEQQIAVVKSRYPKIPSVLVEYDRLFDDKEKMLAELARFVGVKATPALDGFIDTSLRRIR